MADFQVGEFVTQVIASSDSRTRSNSAFIRELWSDEIIASYKNNLVMQPLVVQMNHNGKKGDTVHIPRPTRGEAVEKIPELQVNPIAQQEQQSQYIIDQHWEYSRLIEDITAIQADDTLRAFYTDDSGFALAKRTDTDLHALGAFLAACDEFATVEGTAYSKAVVGSDGAVWDPAFNTNAGNGSALTDVGIRNIIQCLDDNDVPHMGRVLIIPPVEKNNLTGIPRFTEEAFIGERGMSNTIRNGYVGNMYGVEVYVSTNNATVIADDASTTSRASLLFQKEALLHISQLSPRTQTQYKQEYLSDLFTADMIYGTGILRPEAGTAIIGLGV